MCHAAAPLNPLYCARAPRPPCGNRAGLPDDLELHHIIVNDWQRGVTADQNVVLVSIASVSSAPSQGPNRTTLQALSANSALCGTQHSRHAWDS